MDKFNLSKEYFNKALESYDLALSFLLDPSLSKHEEGAVREIFHVYELLMKAHIANEHPMLLVKENAFFDKNNKPKVYDEMMTKAANELVDLLSYLKRDDTNYSFLQEFKKNIEKIRKERNYLEHSSRKISSGYKGVIIVPFIRNILFPLFVQFDPKTSIRFNNSELVKVLGIVDDFTELVPDKNKYKFEDNYFCDRCDNFFSFINKDEDELFCVVCEDVNPIVDCPLCGDKGLLPGPEKLECKACENEILPTKGFIQGDGCSCGGLNFLYLEPENGNEEAFCFSCKNKFELWKCEQCNNFFSDDKGDPPEENPVRCCEDCAHDLRAVYADIH